MGMGKGYTRYCTGIRNIYYADERDLFEVLVHSAVACTLGVQ